MKKLKITVDGKAYNVEVELLDSPAGAPQSQPTPVAPVSSGSVSVSAPAAPTPVKSAAPAAAGSGDVPSPLSGKVVAVNVSVGQAVNEGDQILTLEAMKMNTFIFAPASGKITQIAVAVGDAVEEGQMLAQIQ